MKYCLSILLTCGISTFIYAQQTVTSKATLQNVTVYNSAAELNHNAKATVAAGNSEIVIKNLSNSIDPNTIQVGADKDITIMSVTSRQEFVAENISNPEVKRLMDSIKIITKEKTANHSLLTSTISAIGILDANKIVRGENVGLNVGELQKLMDYYLVKHKDLSAQVAGYTEKDTKYQEAITRYNNRIAELSSDPSLAKGEIVLQVINNSASTVNFDISYLSYNAAWSPMYDIKAKDTKSPLKLIYKALIVQNTGIDWEKVKLTISTSNPSQNSTVPILSAWFLNYYTPTYRKQSSANYYQNNAPAAVMNSIQSIGRLEDKGGIAEKTINDFTTTTEMPLNATFDIDIPYDIASDNKQHAVSMKDYDLNARYKYYAVPKLDKDVFLLAEISDWEQLNLVAGPANIIFDGKYVGKSFIDPNSTQDTLNLSLGRDKKIIVKREKVQDYCSSKYINGNKVHTIVYDIKIKNTRKEAITLLLKDQHPISTNKDITIEVNEISGAMRNEETGVLTWPLEVGGNEAKKVRVSYTVKHPKDKVIGSLW